MPRTNINFNADEIKKALEGVAREVIGDFAKLVAFRAKQIVPVRTGRLRDSIKGYVRKARNEERIIGGVSTNTKGMPKSEKILALVRQGKMKKSDVRIKLGYGYGKDVEIGRPSGNYKSTPYLRPSMQILTPAIPNLVKAHAARAALKQSAGAK